jgi:hypothetical protein
MDKRTSKIAAFIESLPMDVSVGNCESTLLATNMELIGGDNKGDCTNDDRKQCYEAKNEGSCKNFSNYCGKSQNGLNCVSTSMSMKDYLDWTMKDKP